MKITPLTASRVLSLLRYHSGDIGLAAHDCRLTLTSISPYTDRATSAALNVLEWLGRHADKPRVLAQLETIAATTN